MLEKSYAIVSNFASMGFLSPTSPGFEEHRNELYSKLVTDPVVKLALDARRNAKQITTQA